MAQMTGYVCDYVSRSFLKRRTGWCSQQQLVEA